MKKLFGFVILIAIAISSGHAMITILKKAGLKDIFDFDLFEEND